MYTYTPAIISSSRADITPLAIPVSFLTLVEISTELSSWYIAIDKVPQNLVKLSTDRGFG